MSDETWNEVVAFLSAPETHGADAPVELARTHGALVFLAGGDAYKIKRPVRYDYLDFSTPEKREAMLRREMALNAPAAPEIYRGLVPVTRQADGNLALGGQGTPLEWCLHMTRFDREDELARVAARGELTPDLGREIGRVVAAYHAGAPVSPAGDGAARLRRAADDLGDLLAGMTSELGEDAVARRRAWTDTALAAQAPLLDARSSAGHVRRCHGDLHLGNMVLVKGRPVPFDALEFDERMATVDVLYDLAFVLMDMWQRDLPGAANAAFNAYLFHADTPDHLDGLAAMPLFLSLRASVRAMVAVQAARLGDAQPGKLDQARRYLSSALAFLAPAPPRLVAVGGLSGTGKTTLARDLAPGVGAAPGAVHLRSDLERKALFGADPLTRLPQRAYTPEVGERVYDRLADKAERALAAGHSAVIDAVFLKEAERDSVAALAERCGVPFTGLWLVADEATLLERVEERRGDASDADAAVVRRQLAADRAVSDWTRIDAGGRPGETLDRAKAALKPQEA
ncbi:bifunctional aminoglycoside phosphotransferase/ATP-binding protein [Roseovarius salinarum]|uniref:bifunctional aminoglycoside phosphotransferase/ATP-binding protein n=1 Tax=Roseovarius salinarum TaxID=1981892 RepID=UPI000C34C8BF|nr:bifunctional aminoglycoside phosphotransferase/ATP-binding protein [Roseovarius salinarum]